VSNLRSTLPALLAAGLAGAPGCQNQIGTGPIHDDRGAYNAWTIQTVNDGAVRNAIVAQHTLYPYHFVDYSGDLNDLGKRDTAILAAHYKRYPGELNVHRGPEPDGTYQARLKAVADALASGGVASNTIKIGDGMPGGDGISSTRVITILQAENQRLAGAGTAGPSSSSQVMTSGSGSGATSTTATSKGNP
jgi:hypothetical protein